MVGWHAIITSETLEAERWCFRPRSLKPSQGQRPLRTVLTVLDWQWLIVRFTGSGGENPALREPQQQPSKSSRRKWRCTEPFIYKAVSHTQRLGMDLRTGWTWGREGPGLRGQPGMELGRWGLPWLPSGLHFQPGGRSFSAWSGSWDPAYQATLPQKINKESRSGLGRVAGP